MKNKYIVKIIHYFKVEADNEDEAIDEVLNNRNYSQACNCEIEAEQDQD